MAKTRMPVNPKIWDESWMINLEADEKLIYIYLVANPSVNIIGIYECSLKLMSLRTGVALKRIEEIINKLETLNKIYYDHDYIIIPNYFAYNPHNFNFEGKRIQQAIRNIQPDILEKYGKLVGLNQITEGQNGKETN